LVPRTDLADSVRRRYRRRRLHQGSALGGFLTLGCVVSIAAVLAAQAPPRPSMRLAGYTVTLPADSHVVSALGPCAKVAVQLNAPAGLTPAATSDDAIVSPSGTGCISGLLTWVYGTGTDRPPDSIAPTGAQSATVGSYSALEVTASNGFTYYVQLPASGGGYQDLVVGSVGLPQQEVVNLTEQAIADHMSAVTTTG
jgi:hypothetical protein